MSAPLTKVPIEILCSEFLKIMPADQHQILAKLRKASSEEHIFDLLSDFFEIQHLLTDGEYRFFVEGLCITDPPTMVSPTRLERLEELNRIKIILGLDAPLDLSRMRYRSILQLWD
jgi:hypothetical protein